MQKQETQAETRLKKFKTMRILGVNIPDEKRALISLTYIRGIGSSCAEKILAEAGIDKSKRTKDLDAKDVSKIQSIIDAKFKVEGELRQNKKQNITRLKEIKSYRGTRHMKSLPLRGQRTRKNSRTIRGNVRKTVGSGKRKIELK